METDEHGRIEREPQTQWNWSIIFIIVSIAVFVGNIGGDYIFYKYIYEEPTIKSNYYSNESYNNYIIIGNGTQPSVFHRNGTWFMIIGTKTYYRGFNWTGINWAEDGKYKWNGTFRNRTRDENESIIIGKET